MFTICIHCLTITTNLQNRIWSSFRTTPQIPQTRVCFLSCLQYMLGKFNLSVKFMEFRQKAYKILDCRTFSDFTTVLQNFADFMVLWNYYVFGRWTAIFRRKLSDWGLTHRGLVLRRFDGILRDFADLFSESLNPNRLNPSQFAECCGILRIFAEYCGFLRNFADLFTDFCGILRNH